MTARFSPISIVCGLLLPVFLLGCGSAQKKRLDLRDKLASSSGMYCEFVSGDIHDDIDVELNLQLARKCDGSKSMTMTNYKNSSENIGIIYCCSMKKATPVQAQAPKENKENEGLDLSDEPAKPASEKKTDKPALPPKTNPSTLNNPAAPTSAAPKAPVPAKAASSPAITSAPSTSSSAQTAAKPSTPAAQQNPTPKAPNKTSDLSDADILGE